MNRRTAKKRKDKALMEKQYTVKERLKDSSWVTMAWEWFQTLLGRAVDSVLWVTMIFACYQLIPGALQPAASVSVFMFVAQFVALDIGGLSLNQMARSRGLPKYAYARIVAYILIGITLTTLTFAGIQHAVPHMDPNITIWVEVILVVARSVMTVLYGQAIHTLKAEEQKEHNRVAELEQQVSDLQEQLNTEQQTVSSLQQQQISQQQQAGTLQRQLEAAQQEFSQTKTTLEASEQQVIVLQEERDGGRNEQASLQRQLSVALVEVDTLRVQLEGKSRELVGLREMMENGQEWQESRIQQMLVAEQKRVASLQEQLEASDTQVSTLREQLNRAILSTDEQTRTMTNLQRRLSDAEQQVQDLTPSLEQKSRDYETTFADLQSAKVQIGNLQNAVREAAKSAKNRPAKSGSQPANVDNITSIETAKRDRISHADVLAYMATNPDLKRAEVAANLGISERKVYDAVAWGKEQETAIAPAN
jgi:septal ring factor EnvC (AmiA/AmiB activator)